MNKTIIININGIVFHIEEDAYETLRAYMIDIKRHFGRESREILEDIENRIAEMFDERIQTGKKEVINMDDVREVIERMGRVSDFERDGEDEDGFRSAESAEKQDVPHSFQRFGRKLMRDTDDQVLGGVCRGLAHYFGTDARWIRVLFAALVLFGGSGFMLYVVLWIAMPAAESRADKMAMRGKTPNLQNFKKSFEEEARSFSENFSGKNGPIRQSARLAGKVAVGFLALIGRFTGWILLLISILMMTGLFIWYAFNQLNFLGMENPIIFPPLEMLSNAQALIAATFGFLAMGIPFLALFLWLIRILFKTERMSNYMTVSILAAWLLSVVGVIYYCVDTSQDFREESTIRVQRDIDVQDVYRFSERDVRVLDGNERNSPEEKFNIRIFNVRIEGKNFRKQLRPNIWIHFESTDPLARPHVQYRYSAEGRTYDLAAERAGDRGHSGGKHAALSQPFPAENRPSGQKPARERHGFPSGRLEGRHPWRAPPQTPGHFLPEMPGKLRRPRTPKVHGMGNDENGACLLSPFGEWSIGGRALSWCARSLVTAGTGFSKTRKLERILPIPSLTPQNRYQQTHPAIFQTPHSGFCKSWNSRFFDQDYHDFHDFSGLWPRFSSW